MKHLLVRAIAVIGLSSLLFVNIATAVETTTTDPYTDDPSITVTLEGSLNVDGKAELSWNQYEGSNFLWYKVVHSQTNMEAVYPTDSYVEAKSDVTMTTYTHADVPAGTNYYRVCVITDANLRGCSNTVTLVKESSEVVTFDDIASHWSKTYVEDLATKGVVEGRDGNFEPDAPIYRAEAVKLVLVGLSFQEVECDPSIFPDTEVGDWFCGIVTKAYLKGVIQGDDGYFYPARNITRAEAVKILLKTKGIEPPALDADPFPDVPKTEWYAGYAYKAKVLGYVEGIDGKFEPNKEITRAELAKIVSLAS